METSIVKSTMRSGLILGVLFSVNFFFSVSNNTILGLLSWLVVAGIIVLTFRFSGEYRDKELGGFISYGWSLCFILLSFFYASIISTFVKIIHFQFIDTEFLSNMFNQSMLIVEQMGMPITNEIEASVSSFFRPIPFSSMYFILNMIGGLILGLIMAAFVKKEKSIFEQ